MRKEVWEILEEINTDPSAISKYKDNSMLRLVLKNNFLEEYKWLLPDGNPPYKESNLPEGMSPNSLYQECTRFYTLRRTDLKSIKREAIFINMLQSVDPKEAKILLAIKDQELSKLYPNVTRDSVKEILDVTQS